MLYRSAYRCRYSSVCFVCLWFICVCVCVFVKTMDRSWLRLLHWFVDRMHYGNMDNKDEEWEKGLWLKKFISLAQILHFFFSACVSVVFVYRYIIQFNVILFLLIFLCIIRKNALTFSIIQTKLIVDPISTCNSPEPRMNASGTTTCRLTKCDITPVDVETYTKNREKITRGKKIWKTQTHHHKSVNEKRLWKAHNKNEKQLFLLRSLPVPVHVAHFK